MDFTYTKLTGFHLHKNVLNTIKAIPITNVYSGTCIFVMHYTNVDIL